MMDKKQQKFYIADENNSVKWLTGHNNEVVLPKKFTQHAEIKRWCEENCGDVVCYVELYIKHGDYIEKLYFYNNEDAVAFKLRWT